MTSNIGSDLIRQDRSIGFAARGGGDQTGSEAYERMKDNVLDEVKRFFRPEFLNRIDGTVVFHALNMEHMRKIVDLLLMEVASSLIERGIDMHVTEKAKDWLCEKGYDPTFGARPLRRVIQDNLEDKLSDAVLSGALNPAETAVIDIADNEIVINARSESEVPVAPV